MRRTASRRAPGPEAPRARVDRSRSSARRLLHQGEHQVVFAGQLGKVRSVPMVSEVGSELWSMIIAEFERAVVIEVRDLGSLSSTGSSSASPSVPLLPALRAP